MYVEKEGKMQNVKLFISLLQPLSALDSIYSIFQCGLKRMKYKWSERVRKFLPVGLSGPVLLPYRPKILHVI